MAIPVATRTHHTTCPACSAPLRGRPKYESARVCDECGHHLMISIDERIASLVDPATFDELDRGLRSADPLLFADDEPYPAKLLRAQEARKRGDAAAYGRATIHGFPVVLFVIDFGFMGGSMGVVVGEKLVRASELARKERRALISVVSSGGARMQEGLL